MVLVNISTSSFSYLIVHPALGCVGFICPPFPALSPVKATRARAIEVIAGDVVGFSELVG